MKTSVLGPLVYGLGLRGLPVEICIGYNLGIDDGAGSKFGTHKEPIGLNILKYKYCVDRSRDISRDHFAINCKLLTNW